MPLYMAGHYNTEVDQRIWWSVTEDGRYWVDDRIVPGANSATAPSLASWNNRLYLAWRGIHTDDDDDPALWWTSFDGAQWLPVQRYGSRSQGSPYLISRNDRLHMYWRGELKPGGGEDQRVYHATFDGNSWSQPVAIFGGREVTNANIFVTNAHTARIHLIANDVTGDTLYWSDDGYNWDVNNRFALPSSTDGYLQPTLVGFPGFMTSTLLLTYVKNIQDYQVYGCTSVDRGQTWSAEFAVTGVKSVFAPRYATWGNSDPYAVWRIPAPSGTLYPARPAHGPTWRDPRTGNPPTPITPPILDLGAYPNPVLAAHGPMLFD